MLIQFFSDLRITESFFPYVVDSACFSFSVSELLPEYGNLQKMTIPNMGR